MDLLTDQGLTKDLAAVCKRLWQALKHAGEMTGWDSAAGASPVQPLHKAVPLTPGPNTPGGLAPVEQPQPSALQQVLSAAAGLSAAAHQPHLPNVQAQMAAMQPAPGASLNPLESQPSLLAPSPQTGQAGSIEGKPAMVAAPENVHS